MEPREILDRLSETFAKEGLQVELMAATNERVEIRAKRVAPGVPVAFLVKAIEGTFKRYHPTIREVMLSEYDPGEAVPVPEKPSPQWEKVLKHGQSLAQKRKITETMGLDLAGLDRAEGIRALENAHRVWTAQGVESYLVRGLHEDGPARAFEKWLHFYELHAHAGAEEGVQVVHRQPGCPGACWAEPVMWMPARVVLGS